MASSLLVALMVLTAGLLLLAARNEPGKRQAKIVGTVVVVLLGAGAIWFGAPAPILVGVLVLVLLVNYISGFAYERLRDQRSA